MNYKFLLFSTILLSGCQGAYLLEETTSNHDQSNDSSIIDLTSETINQHCRIDHQRHSGTYVATGQPQTNSQQPISDISEKIEPDLWDILARSFSLPVPDNKRIRQSRHWFVNNPYHIRTVSRRAEPFLYLIYDEVQQRNMPIEVALLPFIESAFDQFAYSPRSAAGLWQITVPTGKTFGLEYRKGYDGGRDVLASTAAALDLLEYLHEKFNGNWLHAIAAYNTGGARVRNAIKKNKSEGKSTDFWALELPKETRWYVPKLLAMADIIKHHKKYDLDFATIKPEPALSEVIVNTRVQLNVLASHAEISSKAVYALNPGYTAGYTLAKRDNRILLPKDKIEAFYKNEGSLDYVKYKFTIHNIQPGESLSELAQINNTTVSHIKQINKLSDSIIIAGQQLLIPLFYTE
ncbi:transglycosylase SLT domain-containing protein [Photobacterium sp.]|uniref:transglycosylase SLT domain-containing protein n=1 Tax=Photobacterium sp. TaxID=660 RepID=UPI00299CF185|nr:transglycosylase SLT domain-containing protein [Photobacterium sp.]MDX1301800.1 transglycosylase SLT domain-containing protein [Photobacterium sp.]